MKNLIKISGVIICILTAGCSGHEGIIENKPPIEEKVDTLGRKIAQMLITSYSTSTEYDNYLKTNIQSYNPGGFILFSGNILSYGQVTNLIKNMQSDSEIPMFIAVDQEGGRVQRFKENVVGVNMTIIPDMYKVGLKNDPELAYKIGKVIGTELCPFGVNMDFAPCLDIYSNPQNTVIGTRSFGSTPELVGNMGTKVAKGIADSGIMPVFKHFPGHGDTAEDSHYDLPVLNKTKEELYNFELKPFIEAVNNGAKVIMIGHIALSKIDGTTPASLSSLIIKDLLKKELGFKGLVITDALNMGALYKSYSNEEIIIYCINAGVDILLMMPGAIQTTIDIIKKALQEGKIKEEDIDRSVEKILALKREMGLFDEKSLPDKNVIGTPEHKKIVADVLN